MHVIPVEKAIEAENTSIDLEHISHWLDKYDGKYAASPCSCRRSRMTFDEGCADDPEGWCVAVGDMADYVVETGKGGRYITREEALDIFRQGEENGFVHQITNIDGKDKIFAICNCNVNVCYALRTSQLFNTPNLSRSAYVARVEKADCVACGKCVESCPAGAVKLGRKLCTKDGSEIQYPKHPLPSEQKWGPHMWDEDYRDNNRINCYETGTSPCKTACPAHIAVQGYLKMAAQGRYQEALALIKQDNPLPAICGRICNRRCEDACTRGSIDRAIAIDEVKKFIAQQDLNAETRYIPKKVVPSLDGSFQEKIAVIGAGPAGLTAAQTLARRGFKVSLYEKEQRAGGQVIAASACHLKDKLYWCIEDLMTNAAKDGVEIKLGTAISAQEAAAAEPFAVVVATGGTPIRPKSIPGTDLESVVMATEIIMGEKRIENKKVVVVGSGITGLEVTEFLNDAGCEVTVIEMADEIAPGAWFQLVDDEMERIRPYGTKFATGTKLVGIEPGRVLTENKKTGEKGFIEADNVVLSLGVRPVDGLVRELEELGVKNVIAVGDAKKSGTIADACHSAYDAVMNIV